MTSQSLRPGLYIHREGPADPAVQVVLVHGAMDSSQSMAGLATALPARSTIRYDRRGYGRSALSPAAAPPSLTDHIDDLEHLLGTTPTLLLGHSLGATISLAVAARRPELVRGAVAYEPPLPWEPWWPAPGIPASTAGPEEIRGAAAQFMRRLMGDARWEALDDRRKAMFAAWGPVWATELREAQSRPLFTAENLSLPVVVAFGSETDDRHRRGAATLAQRLPDARLEVVRGGTHAAHRRSPGALARLADDLLSRLPAPDARPHPDNRSRTPLAGRSGL
ncbi:alpha/beta fold hydrolase [Nocardia jinanensis]|uniref:AB hydrolase-1 domain-containing protein n=1 Tax=Nocardia jinanensis TaxID=382504 RepID=A0A917RJS3_9NOCA|nr:alpha/beta hydrolase [Nocardia jinanensis]GGL11838.1 hypothetical protein GCM10011588_27800 [Nocardia jinanensis]